VRWKAAWTSWAWMAPSQPGLELGYQQDDRVFRKFLLHRPPAGLWSTGSLSSGEEPRPPWSLMGVLNGIHPKAPARDIVGVRNMVSFSVPQTTGPDLGGTQAGTEQPQWQPCIQCTHANLPPPAHHKHKSPWKVTPGSAMRIKHLPNTTYLVRRLTVKKLTWCQMALSHRVILFFCAKPLPSQVGLLEDFSPAKKMETPRPCTWWEGLQALQEDLGATEWPGWVTYGSSVLLLVPL
jgi:hypothetical protein